MINKLYNHIEILIIIIAVCDMLLVIIAELRTKRILKSINDIDNLKEYHKKITKRLFIAKICFGVSILGGLVLAFLHSQNIINYDIIRLLPIISSLPIAPLFYYSSIEKKLTKKL